MPLNFSFTLHRTLDTPAFMESNQLAKDIHKIEDKVKRKGFLREFLANVNYKETWSSITTCKAVNKDNKTLLKLTDNALKEYTTPSWSTLQNTVLQEIRDQLRLHFHMELGR